MSQAPSAPPNSSDSAGAERTPGARRPSSLTRFLFSRSQPFIRQLLLRLELPEDVVILGSALIVGLGTGLAAVLFVMMLNTVRRLADLSRVYLGEITGTILIMTLAGFVVGVLIERWAKEARGGGIPDVMEAVAVSGGYIRHRVAEARMVATSITIGSGGSGGREGPVVQIGAGLGSTLGQLFHFSEERMRTLVACGAAAGIAAVFNAPIAGSIFAMEVILNSFNVRYFGAVVIGAVASSVVARVLLGDRPAFTVPAYPLHHVGELPIYAGLGVIAAFVAILFVNALFHTEALFNRLPVPLHWRTALGMLLTAFITLVLPREHVLDSGLVLVGTLITENVHLPVMLLLALLAAKLVATSLTLGSGNSGGVFAPSLFMGALLGGAVGTFANSLWPQVAPNPGAYAIVGMAAVFAGAARGPITAVLIVFEMSGDYKLILPLMMATVISTVLAESLMSDSIYTRELRKRGISLQYGRDVDVMQSVLVNEVMTTDVKGVEPSLTISDLSELFALSRTHGFPVLDNAQRLLGVVALSDLDRALINELPAHTPIMEIATPFDHLLLALPDETMWEALTRMGTRGLGRLPVVDPHEPTRLVGIIKRSDIIRAYNIALTRRAERQHQEKHARLRNIDGTEFLEIDLKPGDAAVGRTLQEVASNIPRQCILVSVRRHGRVLIPHGDTIFEAGDHVTAFVNSSDREQVIARLRDRLSVHA
ncbi:MAG: chloride channel protein [Caldilineaceae bacterium]|nr:chloride channel protein [Caldilineaceae bacterium]